MTVALLASVLGGCSSASGLRVYEPVAGSNVRPVASTTGDLLYVSNFLSGEVNAYYYKDGRIGAKALSLTGFREPAGLCTNKDGDVFITDGDGMIYRYH